MSIDEDLMGVMAMPARAVAVFAEGVAIEGREATPPPGERGGVPALGPGLSSPVVLATVEGLSLIATEGLSSTSFTSSLEPEVGVIGVA